VVDEDSDCRLMYTDSLGGAHLQVDAVADGATAWEAVQAINYQLLITEHVLPRLSGVDLVMKVRGPPSVADRHGREPAAGSGVGAKPVASTHRRPIETFRGFGVAGYRQQCAGGNALPARTNPAASAAMPAMTGQASLLANQATTGSGAHMGKTPHRWRPPDCVQLPS
jgi:CheY-like chemotaxis protein